MERQLDPVHRYGVYNVEMKKTTKGKKELSLTIGEVAKQSGVGIETIRFYEREGIIAEPPRRESGYREYDYEVITRIRFIRRAKELGFSLKEISELMKLKVDPRANCSGVKKRAEAKLEEIENKIRDLKRMQKILNEVAVACVAAKPISDCPILKCFDSPSYG